MIQLLKNESKKKRSSYLGLLSVFVYALHYCIIIGNAFTYKQDFDAVVEMELTSITLVLGGFIHNSHKLHITSSLYRI